MTIAEAVSETSCQTYLRLRAKFDVLYTWLLQCCVMWRRLLWHNCTNLAEDRWTASLRNIEKRQKDGVDYGCLAMVRKEMVSLCNSLVCHADSPYQRRIRVSETSGEARITKKKRNPSARPTPRHISFLFLFPAFSEWMLFGSKRFIRTGKHTAWETVYYMWCRLSAMRMQRQTDLYELRQSCDVLRVASFRVQFHANVTKRQLAWQGLLNRRMRTLPTCRTVALHSVA
jgi:hypothetical protein